jgi:hypothetical protein
MRPDNLARVVILAFIIIIPGFAIVESSDQNKIAGDEIDTILDELSCQELAQLVLLNRDFTSNRIVVMAKSRFDSESDHYKCKESPTGYLNFTQVQSIAINMLVLTKPSFQEPLDQLVNKTHIKPFLTSYGQ